MQETLSLDLVKLAAKSARDEYTDGAVYQMLSRHEKNQSFKKALEDLARGEQSHYEFWKAYTPDTVVHVNQLKVYFTLLLRLTLGLTFTMKFLERHEDALHERYREMVKSIPPADKARFEAMMEEEEHHMSFIVLGLADAVVEISGIHAGSLGIYNRTELAGIAGVVAGMAASIAMASAAYAQAKQGFEGSAKWSAIYTGVSYMFTAIFLALPYFLTSSMLTALGISLIVGVALVAMMTYYDTVISARKFKRQFAEIAGIILAASLALYIAGILIRQFLGISI
ncbi:rubrerythrin family protein [Candidatus Bathyarchaeota archaeon]|nr:MAG: rubrerythrin family protein [Candidatus Bathyarchaeota archaeon]